MSTVDETSIISSTSEMNFLKENKLLRLLPNFIENEIYADSLLLEIKSNFTHAIKEKQFYDNFNYNLKLLRRYVKNYNLRFSKPDYIPIIQLLYGVLIQKGIDAVVTLNVTVELKTLLRKSKCLSRSDFTVAWKPLYDIWYHHSHSSKAKNGIICSPKSIKDPIVEVTRLISRFFPEESTEEIWLLARPYLHCPYPLQSSKHNGLKILKLLLPFYYNNKKPFFDLIWPHLQQMMSIATWTSKCEQDLMVLLGRASSTYVGLIDWTPHFDQLFTALLRSLKIKVSGCSKRTKFNNTKVYVDILVYSIYGDNDCESIQRFRKLFQAVGHLFHPSSHNHNTGKLLNLLYQISAAMLNRYQNERVKKPNHSSFGNYPKEFYITDGHIKNMVNIMLPSCEFAIFTKGKSDFGAVLSSVQKLACLCPEIMVPACLKLFHETSETVLEPHRALSTLAVVSMLHGPLLNSVDRYPEGKLAVFPLMRQLITYININDPPKSYISIICFGNLANILWMEDFSDNVNDANLTPFEKDVALATAQFEDLVLQFFDKLFDIIDIGFSESEMMESQRNSDFRTEMLIDALVMVIPNLSSAISQEVLDKTIDFAFGHSFLSEPIQQFFIAIFGCLLEREDIAENGLNKFIPRYMRYFRGLVRDDCIIIHEKMDFKFVWLSNLLPSFIKTQLLSQMVDNIMEVLLELFRINTFESYKMMDLLLTYSLNHCTHQSASLGIISNDKNKHFYLNSWSGLVTRSELCRDTRYKMVYNNPGVVEQTLLERIITEIISPTLERLLVITDIIKHDKDEKIGNKELRSICNILLTVCECDMAYLVSVNDTATQYQFTNTHGPLPLLHSMPKPPSLITANVLNANNSTNSILHDIKHAAHTTLQVVYNSITSKESVSRLKIPLSDIEDLFQLLHRSHDLRSGAVFYGQNKSFLDRRFESFIHPLRKMSNTMLNWVLMIDDWNGRRFRLPSEPLTDEISSLADTLFLFLGLPHSTLQRSAVQCLYNLLSGYCQLDEYLIHKSMLLVTDKSKRIDEHLHAGISQLLLKIFENKVSYESVTFVYKLISIFVALGRSPHVDVRNNRNLHSKMFDLLVQLMGSFVISSDDDNITFDFQAIIATISPQNSVICQRRTNGDIIEGRKQLYYSCLEYCLSCYLDNSVSNDDVPLFVQSNISCSLSSTTTWQSIYQMSIILPLHIELPIPLRFLELFFLIIFSPSKELSSQGCNQINIVVWLLKQSIEKLYRTPKELGLNDLCSSSCITPGPRSDNDFLVTERNTNYWQLPDQGKLSDISNGYLWWPQRIKIRHGQDKVASAHNLVDSNRQCWSLLCRVFESEDFSSHLLTFLLDLGSQFLREEETCPPNKSLLNTFHQFAIDHLINSIFICIGPSKALPLTKKVYERLVRCTDSNQVYANKMSVQVLSGILMSTKHWPANESYLFFTIEVLTFIDLYLEHSCKSEVRLISKCLIDVCTSMLIDYRQLLPVYRHFLNRLNDLEHDSNKETVCLNFLRCFAKGCGWRIGSSIIDDMCDLWRKFVTSPVEKLRKEASNIMKLLTILPLLTNQYHFCADEQKLTFQKFPSELIQMFANQTQLVLSKKGLQPSVVTMKALKLNSPLMTEPDVSDDDQSPDSSMQTMSVATTPIDTPPNEPDNGELLDQHDTAPDKIVSTMISSLITVFMDLDEFISHDLLKMFFICFDLIPVRDKMHIYSHLRHCAVMVANIFLTNDACFGSTDKRLAYSTLFSFIESATRHKSWRVRLIAVKMMQIISFNNFFIVSRSENMSRLIKMTFTLITDIQIEVRKESSVMLSGLIQCSMYNISSGYITAMSQRINKTKNPRPSPNEMVEMHSGVLALCAFIQAHPFDIPSELPEVLTVLCRHINKPEPISSTIKDTLSKFKKSHQDSWHLQRVHFTEDQLCALTDVLVSPSYYA